MKKFLGLIVAAVCTMTLSAQSTWLLDKAHTTIGFAATHMTISEIEGEFQEFEGKVVSQSDGFAGSEVEFTANVGSITTDNDRRDGHLKSDDFFNAEMYPEIKFAGSIIKEGDDHFLVGDLTIRDVTKSIKFEVKYGGQVPGRNGQKAGFKVMGTIDRFDYGLKWNMAMEAGGLMVGKEVEIICRIELNEEAS
ncbi:MAG: YceI family protein [Saprospiraceae bacterium]|nr:YceI family protein [Saprospiraceae bacterium]